MLDISFAVCGSLYPLYDLKRRQSRIYRCSSQGSPFVAYDDGFQWPDLHTECDEMIEACLLVYLLAELRSLVRKGEATQKTERVMQMPLAATDLMKIVNSSRLLLTSTNNNSFFRDYSVDNVKFCHDLLRTTEERNMRAKRKPKHGKGKQPQEIGCEDAEGEVQISPTLFLTFDDELEKEELNYAIGVNHRRRRITVCFRGLVMNDMDWATDFNIYMQEVTNPMKMHSSQQPTMKIHSKIHALLYGQPSEHSQRGTTDDDVVPLFISILKNRIVPVTEKYPGYKLYFTGHSLGGALATLLAFHAASEPDRVLPKPITCISMASPYVGDESFRLAHQLLEGLGKLRHLRISNHKDIVTASPKMSFRWKFYKQDGHVGSLFKHVGMNLRLYELERDRGNTVSFEISYPKVRNGFFIGNYFDEMSRGWDQSPFANCSCNPVDYLTWPWHNLREYNNRITENKTALQDVHLNTLYSRQDIVGDLGSQFGY